MSWTQNDKSFKTLINRRATSSAKAPYEEIGDRTINTHLDEVWVQALPEDPAQAVINGTAEQRSLFTLTEDTSVASHLCYYAEYSGVRLRDWISDKYGSGYAVHLYQNTGAEIFPTDSSDWIFDYQTGILTLNSSSGLSLPLKITGYRYIGNKGFTGIVGLTGMGGGGTGVTGIQGVTGAGYDPALGSITGVINLILDNGNSTLTTGIKGDITLPFGFMLDKWQMLSKETGSVFLSIAAGNYDNYPYANMMHSGVTGPFISEGIKNLGDTSSWVGATGSLGEYVRVIVDSASSTKMTSLALYYHKL